MAAKTGTQITRRNLLGLTGAGTASLALNRTPAASLPYLPARSQAKGTVEMKSTPDPQPVTDANATPAAQPIAGGHYTEVYRPQFHFSPVSGWIGDPDGMIRYKGIYHVFWWGHAESKDLVFWNQRPDPMVGDDGTFVYFSGSVVVDEQNTSGFGDGGQPPMIAIYTMHDRTTGHEDQGLSISHDYTSFHYYDRNPVLDADQAAFRDPQVFWHGPTDRWIMAITLPEDRKVSFYASLDLKTWEHLSDFGPVGARATQWEVPDLFELPVDGDPTSTKWVLLLSLSPNRVQYLVGDFDGSQFTLDPSANSNLLRGDGIPGTVFADFEHGLPPGWTVEGEPIALGTGDNLGLYQISGYLGSGFLSTYTPDSDFGDRGTVTVTSPPFVIERNAINFLVSGGGHSGTSVSLIVDGTPVRSAAGDNATEMKWVGWDVSEFRGAEAQIEIVDEHTAADVGHINVDHIVFADLLMESGREHANWLDSGPDYYAVRTYRDYDHVENRTITMGWMGNWEYANDVPSSWGKGALAIPREIELRSYAGGLQLVQRPIPALERLRLDDVQLNDLELAGTRLLAEFVPSRNTYEIDVTFAMPDPEARFGLRLAVSDDQDVTVGYDARTSHVFLDRTRPENGGFSGYFPKYAQAPLEARDGAIRLRILVDQSSVEVFANDGERTMTALMFPDPGSTGIALFSEGGSVVVQSLRAWELASIWGVSQEAWRRG